MRRVRPDFAASSPLARIDIESVSRSSETLGAMIRENEGMSPSKCLRCVDEPCTSFDLQSDGSFQHAIRLCPSDAIQFAQRSGGPVISSACVGCGLCALRCPVGAITVNLSEMKPTVSAPELVGNKYIPVTDPQEFMDRRTQFSDSFSWSSESHAELIKTLSGRSAVLRQSNFYPLVASLFTLMGSPVWRPVQGDTNNRVDLILIDEVDSIPVEVKSQTEVSVINVKSIQQALENKVIMDSRKFLPTNQSSSTLVVGYNYPPTRSDVSELIDDIYKTFGIKIGLVSMGRLYELAFDCVRSGTPINRSILSSLMGPL